MVVSLDLLKPSLARVVADRVDGKTVVTPIILYCWSRTNTHVQHNTQPQTQILWRYLLLLPARTLSTLLALFQLFGRIGIGIRCHSL